MVVLDGRKMMGLEVTDCLVYLALVGRLWVGRTLGRVAVGLLLVGRSEPVAEFDGPCVSVGTGVSNIDELEPGQHTSTSG